jgi:hypothetical protein
MVFGGWPKQHRVRQGARAALHRKQRHMSVDLRMRVWSKTGWVRLQHGLLLLLLHLEGPPYCG